MTPENVRTLGAGRSLDVHGRILRLVASPEHATTATEHIKHDTATLAEAHDYQMTVGTPSRVVPHLRGAIQGTLVGRDAPTLSSILGRILHVFVATGLGVLLRVQRVANFADCLDNVAWVRRCGAPGDEMVVCLALIRLELFELRAVLELGAYGECSGCVQERRQCYPGNHRECGGVGKSCEAE